MQQSRISEPHQLSVQTKEWLQLYAVASTDKIKTWQTWVTEDIDGGATIWTRHGYLNSKLTDKSKTISTGKNIGKANETTSFEQACSQAQSTYNKKIDKKYITEIPDGTNEPDHILLPMLAQPFEKYKHHIEYPCLVQPKLDGVRCLAQKVSETEINYTSRGGKSYNNTLGHLSEQLLPIMKLDEIFDGEIYIHGLNLQQISRRVKKLRDGTDQLEYWVYDTCNEDPTMHRNDRYFDAIDTPQYGSKIIPVFTNMAAKEADIHLNHNHFIELGYEGAIIRNINANYKFGHRSLDLLKLKSFQDAEFKIVHGYADADGGIVFECKVTNKGTFHVRPKGILEQRTKWFEDLSNIIGKKLTVRFFDYSEDGLPLQPVGCEIRDYE